LTSFLLTTGDLPTSAKAMKIMKEAKEKTVIGNRVCEESVR
jgi:hypothetical protein